MLSVVEECSQCRQRFSIEDLRVVGRNGNLWVLAVRCPTCDAQAFVAAVVGEYEDGTTIEATAIDLTDAPESGSHDPDPEPITVDDVLDMHEFLDAFDGDFLHLFSRRR